MSFRVAVAERPAVCLPPAFHLHPDVALEPIAKDASPDWCESGSSSLPEPMRKHIGAGTQIEAMGYPDWGMISSCSARAAASARVVARSLARIAAMWFTIVRDERTRHPAIFWLLRRRARSAETSTSRAANPTTLARVDGRGPLGMPRAPDSPRRPRASAAAGLAPRRSQVARATRSAVSSCPSANALAASYGRPRSSQARAAAYQSPANCWQKARECQRAAPRSHHLATANRRARLYSGDVRTRRREGIQQLGKSIVLLLVSSPPCPLSVRVLRRPSLRPHLSPGDDRPLQVTSD